jgi:hypothetical protein
MHKNATKCNKTLSKWCKNKHEASKIIDTFETYQGAPHVVTYDDLIAAGAQVEPMAYAGDQDGRCCGINEEERS